MPRARNAGLTLALVAAGAGVLQQSPTLFLGSAIGLVYAAWEAATGTPTADLAVVRSVDATTPSPGDAVEVTLTIRNAGSAPLPDVRVVDGVPETLRVARGSPRIAAALQAGETATTTYELRSRPGEHAFEPVLVESRSLTGGSPDRATVPLEDAISCERPAPPVDVAPAASSHVGRSSADRPGVGQAFHGVREYRRRDPLERIDWRRFARTGDLATVEYETDRAATVVFVVDDRYDFARDETVPTARESTVAATTRLARALLDVHDRVGAVSLATETLVEPGTGRSQDRRLRRLFDGGADRSHSVCASDLHESDYGDGNEGRDHTAADGRTDDPRATPIGRPLRDEPAAADGGTPGTPSVGTVHRAVPDAAHVVLCSPLLDRYSRVLARGLAERGRTVTVISPDVTGPGIDLGGPEFDGRWPETDVAGPETDANRPEADLADPAIDERWDETDVVGPAPAVAGASKTAPPASPGTVVARLTREDRLERLRPHVRLIDWAPDEELALAMARTRERWST